jgi:hypothetical protein
MIVRSRNYDRIITWRAHQVFCKSAGNLAIFTAITPRLVARVVCDPENDKL